MGKRQRNVSRHIKLSYEVLLVHIYGLRIYFVFILLCFLYLSLSKSWTGTKLPNLIILLPVEEAQIQTSSGEKTISIAGR